LYIPYEDTPLKFGEYLKDCRHRLGLTQEQLVHALYVHDTDSFASLDISTISKWERGVTKPKLAKQVSAIRYFQTLSGDAFPCLADREKEKREIEICEVGMQNLLGSSKELILKFPAGATEHEDLYVSHLRNLDTMDQIIDINLDLDKNFNQNLSKLQAEHFKEWALHPSSSFFVCEYNRQFFGLLFALRLKPDIFEKIMRFEIHESALTIDDFASFDEVGCSYMISFFAMNEKAAAALFIRYYAHLIANQDMIAEVGLATMMEDAKKLIRNMNLQHYRDKEMGKDLELQTYREKLPDFLVSEYVVKMVLSKQDCPEE
jgi:transcriptional regulator with XRE-family HTH domain